jgi:hypothetical protein
MEVRPIDANELYRIEKLLDTDIVRQDKVALNLLEQVLYDIQHVPALTQPNEWISVEDRLPEDEARQYIEDELDGIGYLYPCLLTYKSPNTERIHVVRFYYDIIQKWFVNNVEELCEKGRCIAWMPLPAPYDRRPPEGEEDTNA